MKITKEQIKAVEEGTTSMRELFPEVFKTKLEVGKWYKNFRDTNQIIFVLDFKHVQSIRGYGFDTNGKWTKDDKLFSWGLPSNGDYKEATHEEIRTALINEAKKRGFEEGSFAKWAMCNANNKTGLSFKELRLFSDINMLTDQRGHCVFLDGTWAEIIETITKEEAEKLLNKKIILNIK